MKEIFTLFVTACAVIVLVKLVILASVVFAILAVTGGCLLPVLWIFSEKKGLQFVGFIFLTICIFGLAWLNFGHVR